MRFAVVLLLAGCAVRTRALPPMHPASAGAPTGRLAGALPALRPSVVDYQDVPATDGGTVSPSARYPETTVLVPVGTTRTIEFVARAPGDWPLHCHMTHHVMNQMGHEVANVIGADMRGVDAKLGRVVPGYMTMGQGGMAEMSQMHMQKPNNTISMLGGKGPFGMIDMGGMFTLVKVRDKLTGDGDPGWYDAPKASIATEATSADLARDGIEP